MKKDQDIMCKVLEDMVNEEHIRTRLIDIKKIMENLKYSSEQAMDLLGIPLSEQSQYKAKL